MIRGGGAEKMIGDGMINGISKRAASTVDVEKKGADSKKVRSPKIRYCLSVGQKQRYPFWRRE